MIKSAIVFTILGKGNGFFVFNNNLRRLLGPNSFYIQCTCRPDNLCLIGNNDLRFLYCL